MRKEVAGQSSLEFLLVTGIGLLLLVSVSFFFLQQSKSSADKTSLQQATDAGSDIIAQSLYVYSLGANSWVTLDVSMPDNVLAIYTVENNTLVFDVATKNGIVSQPVFSDVPITGVVTVGQKSYVNNSTVIHEGQTRFRIVSQGDIVAITAVT